MSLHTSRVKFKKAILFVGSPSGLARLFLFFTAFVPSSLQGQTLSGYVEDSITGERLVAVAVYDTVSKIGTTTNESGYFSLSGVLQVSVLEISHVAYQRKTFVPASQNLVIKLRPSIWLDSVEVSGSYRTHITDAKTGNIVIPVDQIQHVPATLGERDVLKALQLLPGIQGGNEGQSGIHVRGGSPDQNLILLDGVPLYNVSHLFGFFSSINADAIKNIEVYKGGFPARYAGRLSSIVDITLKDGDMQSWRGDFSVGMLASKINVQGPIQKDKTTLVFSARRTFLDIFAKDLIKKSTNGQGDVGYAFGDLNIKLNHVLAEKDRLSFSTYMGVDAYERSDVLVTDRQERALDVGLGWTNLVSSLRWTREWSSRLFGRTNLTYSSYKYRSRNNSALFDIVGGVENQSSIKQAYLAGISDVSLRFDFDYAATSGHYFRWGSSFTHHDYNPGDFKNEISSFDRVVLGFRYDRIRALEFGLYIEDDWRISKKLNVNAGVHFSGYQVSKETFIKPQWRAALNMRLAKEISLKASYAQMVQYPHLLSNEGVGLPTDLWVPSTSGVKPAEGWIASLGLYSGIREFDVSIEGYYRKMKNVINFKGGSGFLEASDWQDKVIQGEGEVYGIEFLAHKTKGKLSGWLGYVLSWANRRFDDLDNGEAFPYRYDQRHNIKVTASYQISSRFRLSANWLYRTGYPVTVFEHSIWYRILTNSSSVNRIRNNGFQSGYSFHPGRNNFRLSPYHRLDLEATYEWSSKYSHLVSVGIYNAYNRLNPYYLSSTPESRIDTSGNRQSVQRLKQFSLFPRIPSITYRFSF